MRLPEGLNFGSWCLFAFLITCCLCDTPPSKPDNSNQATAKCIVTEPLFNATFDLSGLRSTMGYQFLGYTFNVCGGTLAVDCNGQKNVGACLRRSDGKEVVLGLSSGSPEFKNSRPHFNFAGEKCNEKANYSLVVQADCDYQMEKDPISVISSSNDTCAVVLRLRSRYACVTSSRPTRCRYPLRLSNQKDLNLAQLPKTNMIAIGSELKKKFAVNFCHPVVYGPSWTCPPDSHVCVYDSVTKKFSSVGDNDVQVHATDVALTYGSNSKCQADPSKNYSSTIFLRHDDSDTLIFEKSLGCEYQFTLYTPLASDDEVTPCVIEDRNRKQTYSFASLMSKTFSVKGKDSAITFGICKAPNGCLDTAGACKDGFSRGMVNDRLLMGETGFPFLEYRDGPDCKGLNNETVKASTQVRFTCAHTDEEVNKATLVEESDCRLVIDFATKESCPISNITCSTDQFDLRPLIRVNKNILADVDESLQKNVTKDEKIFLNICRPLVSEYGLSCPPGSAICRANVSSGKPEKETSLGYPDVSLTTVNTSEGDRPQLKYLRGDSCPAHPEDNSSTTIEFRCSAKAGRGRPVLKRIDEECHHEFEWETNVICGDVTVPFDAKTCSIPHNATGEKFSLKEIGKNGTVQLENATVDLCVSKSQLVEVVYQSQLVDVALTYEGVNVKVVLECHGTKNVTRTGKEGATWMVIFASPSVCKFFGPQLEEDVATAAPSTTLPPPPPVTPPTTPAPEVTTAKGAPTVPSEAPKDTSTASTLTTKSPVPTSNSSSSPSGAESGEKAASSGAPVAPARSGMSAWGITGVLFLICGIFVAVGFLLRSPQRRAQVMSLFRRKNVQVSYTRDFDEPYYSI